jgi:hypothetical protein
MTVQQFNDDEAIGVADTSKKRQKRAKELEYGANESTREQPATKEYRNDPRHTIPYAIPIEALDITPQQIKFVESYLIESNGTRAAISVGCTEVSAGEMASRWLKTVEVEAYMRARLSQIIQSLAINPEFIQAELLDTYRKAKEPVPIYDFDGNFTGEYQFDGRTAVAALGLLAKIRGMLDKPDGRSQIPMHMAIVIGQYNREAAEKLCEYVGIEAPNPAAKPRVEGFPTPKSAYKFNSKVIIDQKPEGEK